MNPSWCGKLSLAAVALGFLANSAIWADDARPTILIREAGKTERRCQIERSIPQANGDTIHEVRDLATGEHFQVVDTRVIKTAEPLVIQAALGLTMPCDARMIAALAASPFTSAANQKRVLTLAEQAAGAQQAVPRLGLFRVQDK